MRQWQSKLRIGTMRHPTRPREGVNLVNDRSQADQSCPPMGVVEPIMVVAMEAFLYAHR
jgi:hypothetical protein